MKKHSLLIVLILFGCATTKKFDDNLKSMVGIKIDSLVEQWGPPDPLKTFVKDNGDRMFTWVKWTSDGVGYEGYCTTTAIVNPNGNVTHWFAKGVCVSN